MENSEGHSPATWLESAIDHFAALLDDDSGTNWEGLV